MNKRYLLLLFILVVLITPAAGCVYHKPEYHGQILDKETKQPIEGAVVVAVYRKTHHGFEPLTHPFHVREALTDKDGKFHITSYTSLIMPIFTTEAATIFAIYKPGYASLSGVNLEDHFSGEKAREEEVPVMSHYIIYTTQTIRFSPPEIVELPKMTTREERKQAWMNADIFGPDVERSDAPILFKLIMEERRQYREVHHVEPPKELPPLYPR